MTQKELVLLQASRLGYEAQDLQGSHLTLEEVEHCSHLSSTTKDAAPQLGSWWFDVFEILDEKCQTVGHIAVSPITSMDEYKYPRPHTL